MSIADVLRIALHTIVVYNTNAGVAASKLVADYYCDQRGIPRANQFGYDFGADPLDGTYNASAFAQLWEPLAALMESIDAEIVAVAAGCPTWLKVINQSTGAPTGKLQTTTALAMAKKIVATGEAPRSYDTSGSSTWLPVDASSIAIGVVPVAGNFLTSGSVEERIGAYGKWTRHPRLDAARTFAGLPLDAASRVYVPSPDFDGRYSRFLELPCGLVGWWASQNPEGTGAYPVDLLDKSKLIINRAVRNEIDLESAKTARRIVVGIGTTTASNVERQALIYDEFYQRGFTDLAYFYWNYSSDVAAGFLADGGSADFTRAELDAGTVDTTYDIGIGIGFGNNMFLPGNVPTWREPGNLQFTPAHPGAIMLAGMSSDEEYAKGAQVDGGVGGRATKTHENSANSIYHWEVANGLLAGRTLAEAIWWDPAASGYWHAIGDPLYRPFIA